jgi:hypothetical protein
MKQAFRRVPPHPSEVWLRVVTTMLSKEIPPSNKESFAKADAVTRQYMEQWWPKEWDEWSGKKPE